MKKPPPSLVEATRRNAKAIANANVFAVLWNDKMVEEVVPLIQMGLAVYLDKPIVVLVPTGVTVPMNMRRLALRVEEYYPNDQASLTAATKRALQVE